MRTPRDLFAILPGLALCVVVTLLALAFQALEVRVFGRAWLEALVLAILLGTIVRSLWNPGPRWVHGIAFGAHTLLEIAVVLLGASLSAKTLAAIGPALVAGVAAVVAVALALSYAIARLLRLPHRMAILIACGNSICGNSAIAAAAPVIGANGDEVACSIAFTAILGVAVVIALPLLVPVLHLTGTQFGILSGLTVYAVPQVLAATTPAGPLAVQIGTVVKLVRVLMLGPAVVALSILSGRGKLVGRAPEGRTEPDRAHATSSGQRGIGLFRIVPGFILAFMAVAAARSLDLIPEAALGPIGEVATILTILSMAALGLGVDVHVVAMAGFRVTLAVILSLGLLGGVSLGLIRVLGIV